MADFGQAEGNLKQPVMNPAHGNVEPVLAKRGRPSFSAIDYFLAADPDMADVGSNPGFSLQGGIQAERKRLDIPSKGHNMVSGQRVLSKAVGYGHEAVTIWTLLMVPKQFLLTCPFWGSLCQ